MPLAVRSLPVPMIEPAFRTRWCRRLAATVLLSPGFPRGKPDSNSAAPDRSAYKSRTPSGISGRGKPAAGEPLLHEPPSARAGGL